MLGHFMIGVGVFHLTMSILIAFRFVDPPSAVAVAAAAHAALGMGTFLFAANTFRRR